MVPAFIVDCRESSPFLIEEAELFIIMNMLCMKGTPVVPTDAPVDEVKNPEI